MVVWLIGARKIQSCGVMTAHMQPRSKGQEVKNMILTNIYEFTTFPNEKYSKLTI
jgi:hypothetical protein